MDLSIVIPFYNEQDNAEEVLKGIDTALKKISVKYEIVAINNGSLDKTGPILQELQREIINLKVVSVPVNKGYGWGVRCGLRDASGEYIGFMCGDNQIEPQALIDVFNKAKNKGLDLCKVKRIKREDGLARKMISFFYNIICPVLFSIRHKDLNGTPKIFKRSLFENLNLISKGWFIDGEIMIKCSKMNCKIGEVPVIFKKRQKGSSKINPKAVLDFLKEMFLYKLKYGKDVMIL